MSRDANLGTYACRSFLEGQRHIVTQIRAALPASPPTSSASPSQHIFKPEKIAENILKFFEDAGVEPRVEAAVPQSGSAVAIVNRLFLRIGEYGVGFARGAKIRFRLFFLFRIAVGMVLQCSFAIGGFNLLRRRFARYTENFIKVFRVRGRHHSLFLAGN